MRIRLILVSLFFAQNAVAKMFDCSSKEPYQFTAAGYLVGEPKADLRGDDLKKDESILRKILDIVNPDPEQPSTYLKAFDIGKYRFVKNKDAVTNNHWDVYRRETPKSPWVLKTDLPNPLKVYADQSLYVKIEGRNTLKVYRHGLDSVAKDFNLVTDPDKITIQGTRNNRRAVHYLLGPCLKETPRRPPTGQPVPAPTKT